MPQQDYCGLVELVYRTGNFEKSKGSLRLSNNILSNNILVNIVLVAFCIVFYELEYVSLLSIDITIIF